MHKSSGAKDVLKRLAGSWENDQVPDQSYEEISGFNWTRDLNILDHLKRKPDRNFPSFLEGAQCFQGSGTQKIRIIHEAKPKETNPGVH